jgi:hypothetical protein
MNKYKKQKNKKTKTKNKKQRAGDNEKLPWKHRLDNPYNQGSTALFL